MSHAESDDESEGVGLSSGVVVSDVVWMGVCLEGVLFVDNDLAWQCCRLVEEGA